MKVIERNVTPNGTEIQLEDWHDQNNEHYPALYGFTIGAYPIAQRTSKYGWNEGGKKFRLSIAMNNYMCYTDDDVKTDYEALKNGTKSLEDLAEHFWNGQKDMWCLGMNVDDPC